MADLGIADDRGDTGQDGAVLPEHRAGGDVVVAGEGADGDVVAVVTDERQVPKVAHVDEDRRHGEAKLHHR